jgi:hypothetical protein
MDYTFTTSSDPESGCSFFILKKCVCEKIPLRRLHDSKTRPFVDVRAKNGSLKQKRTKPHDGLVNLNYNRLGVDSRSLESDVVNLCGAHKWIEVIEGLIFAYDRNETIGQLYENLSP